MLQHLHFQGDASYDGSALDQLLADHQGI